MKPFWHSWRHFRRFCKWLVESSWANTFFALLILSNSVFLGVQLEMQAAYQDVSIQLTVFAAFNVSYAVLFSLEVALRLLACGPSSYLWLSDEYVWNWLDVFVVFASWIELIIFFLTPGSTMGTNRKLPRSSLASLWSDCSSRANRSRCPLIPLPSNLNQFPRRDIEIPVFGRCCCSH